MIIIILFATFVSLFFQSTQYQSSENFTEGFETTGKKNKEKMSDNDGEDDDEEEVNKKHKKENLSNEDEDDHEEEVNKKQKKEGYKYSFQGEEPDMSSNEDNDLGNDSAKPPTTKTAKLKKDMEQYFEIQKELLSVLEKAEPLQQKAEKFKERFNTKKSS